MKKMMMIMVVVAILVMAACGKKEIISGQKDENIQSGIENLPDKETEKFSEEEVASAARKEFNEKRSLLDYNRYQLMKKFADSPQIDEEFMLGLEKVQEEYVELMKWVKKLPESIYTYKEELGKSSIQDVVEGGWVTEPYVLIDSDSVYDTTGINYQNGVFTLKEGYYVTLEWANNNLAQEISLKKDDFDFDRSYKILDKSKTTYILLLGVEDGYWLVQIHP